MKPALALVGLFVLTVGYYQACAIPSERRAALREARDAGTLDSIRTAAEHARALEAVRDSARRAWLVRDSAAADSLARLRRQLTRARDSAAVLVTRLNLAGLPDSTREAVTAAVGMLTARAEICELALGVQTRRLTDCQRTEATADSLTRQVVPSLHAAVDSALAIAQRWQVRASRAGRRLALGPYVGYGVTAVDGRAVLGPQVGLGLTLRWVPLPPW